ncbi:MAG: prolipoprotein diacylglyceryl transferase [bacterium]|nr:prolipoprotein diacylglyceryl transferase [bacterium]MDD6225767.1 prolipoprotein diacylglyceryl transferase [bacterium]MDY3861355.1 prolipoprotein diacylglyceryl transferase [Ruminococcus sp.]
MYNVSFPGLGINGLSVNPVALSVGNFQIFWYGIIIASGLVLAFIYAWFSSSRFNVDRNKLINCVLVGIITGIIGARLYYVLFSLDYYLAHPVEIFYIHRGGLAIYGGIIGALLGGCIVAKIQNMKVMPVLDIASLGFLIGQGIGRWGNFANQEAFGTPTDLPWGMISENTGGVTVHPCFLYESIWCLLGFVIIHFLSKKFQKYSGQVFYMYLVWYGFERMLVEGLRTDSLYLPFTMFGAEIRVSQLLSLLLVIFGVVMLIINRKKEDPFYADYRRKKSVG